MSLRTSLLAQKKEYGTFKIESLVWDLALFPLRPAFKYANYRLHFPCAYIVRLVAGTSAKSTLCTNDRNCEKELTNDIWGNIM